MRKGSVRIEKSLDFRVTHFNPGTCGIATMFLDVFGTLPVSYADQQEKPGRTVPLESDRSPPRVICASHSERKAPQAALPMKFPANGYHMLTGAA